MSDKPAYQIYFMRPVGMEGPIKIGGSKWPICRMKQVMMWSPFALEILAHGDGNGKLERFLHKKFALNRSHHEWFHPSTDLILGIAAVRAGASVEEAFGASLRIRAARTPQHPSASMHYIPAGAA